MTKPIILLAAWLLIPCAASAETETIDSFFAQCQADNADRCLRYILGAIDQITEGSDSAGCIAVMNDSARPVIAETIARLGDMQKAGHGEMPIWRATRSAIKESAPECFAP